MGTVIMDASVASSLLLSLGVRFLLLTLFLSRSSSKRPRSFDAVTNLHPLDIELEPAAFSIIWTPIFSLLFASAVYAAFESVHVAPAACLAAAEVLSGLWVPLFLCASTWSLVAAAAALASAAASGAVALLFIGAINPINALAWHHILCLHVSFGLFVGWLLCAATLSIGFALRAATGWVLARPALLATATVATALAVASRNPVVALPCAWACVWQRQFGVVEIVGILICSAGVGLSLAI